MYRITRNLWIDERRAAGRRGVHAPIDEAVTQIAGDGAAEVEAGAMRGDVDGAMAHLPCEQREVVMLVLCRRLAPIAKPPRYSRSRSAPITSRLARGRETLMHLLGEAA